MEVLQMSVTDKVELVSLTGFLALLASAAALTPARAVWCLHCAMPAHVIVIEVFVRHVLRRGKSRVPWLAPVGAKRESVATFLRR